MDFLFKIFSLLRFCFLLLHGTTIINRGTLDKKCENKGIKQTRFRIAKGAKLTIGAGCRFNNSTIWVKDNSSIEIDENCIFNNVFIVVEGSMIVGAYNIFSNMDVEFVSPKIEIDGTFHIGSYNRISCNIWTRFSSVITIGNRNNINYYSEIRCDEKITIGDYNQISYNVFIWDTNTHNILKPSERREITDQTYPEFGYECKKPKTKKVAIGNDCWIGRNAVILKGSNIGDEVIIGYGCILADRTVNNGKTIVLSTGYKIYDNKYDEL